MFSSYSIVTENMKRTSKFRKFSDNLNGDFWYIYSSGFNKLDEINIGFVTDAFVIAIMPSI